MTIEWVEPSLDVQVTLIGHGTLQGPKKSTVLDFFTCAGINYSSPVVGAILNGELCELTTPVVKESTLAPVLMRDADGARIYRRSLSFLLSAAFSRLFPDAVLNINYSVYPGGYYCDVSRREPLNPVELLSLKAEMVDLVTKNLSFEKKEVPLAQAIEIFSKLGELDKVQLLHYRTKDHVTIYSLGSYLDYHQGYMVPSTSFLKWFDSTKLNRRDKITEGIFAPWAFYRSDFQQIGGHDILYAPQSKEDSDIFNRFQ